MVLIMLDQKICIYMDVLKRRPMACSISCWCCSKLMSAECTDTWHKLHHAEAINEGVALPGKHMADLVFLSVGLGRHWLCNAWTWLWQKKKICARQLFWNMNSWHNASTLEVQQNSCYQRRCGHVDYKANFLSNNVGHLKGTVSKHYHKQLE